MDNVARELICYARQCTADGGYREAFEHYFKAFKKCPRLMPNYEPEFRALLKTMSKAVTGTNNTKDLFASFHRAGELFSSNIYLLNDIGKYFYKFAVYDQSWDYFAKALKIDSNFVNADKNLNSIKNLLVERWHFRMLNDKIRNQAYYDAIHNTLIPKKDSILDIGTGTGLLAMFAQELDPMAVTAIDSSEEMTKIAEKVTQDAGMMMIVIVNGLSTSMNFRHIGGKRSVILTELFDAGLFGEHVLQTLAHAWEHLINSTGRVIPSKAEFFVMGAKSDHLNRKYQLSTAAKGLLKIPKYHVHVLTFDETYDCEDVHLIEDIKYMTEPQSLIKVDFNDSADIKKILTTTAPITVDFSVTDNGEINTFIGWFNLYLTDKITLTTDPRSENRANAWQQAVFFDSASQTVKKNDILSYNFLINGGKLAMAPDDNIQITRVSPETVRFLNDEDYVKTIMKGIATACVYLGQSCDLSEVKIVDLCPFPLFGLQMLKRGVSAMVCYAKTTSEKRFFKKVFRVNKLPLSKITILVGENLTQEAFKEERFHAIFCNIFELCGDIDLRLVDLAHHLEHLHLTPGGLFMPAEVKVMAQLVDCRWLDINNRVYNENVLNYKLSEKMHDYMVSQNFCIDFSQLKYTALTEPVEVGVYGSGLRTKVFNVPLIAEGEANTILCWYSIELIKELQEISTNRSLSFIDGIAYLVNPKILMVGIDQQVRLQRCVDSDGSFKLRILTIP